MSLLHKTAIITGATRGIGLGIAEAFAKQGARTILIGQNESRVHAVESRFQTEFSNEQHKGVVLDISNKEAIEHTLKQVLKEEGSIDYLVNAAGITRNRLLVQMKNDDLEDVINTNLLGTMRVSQLVSKTMLRKRKGGCIINISSVVGLQGNAGQTAYAASKAGVVGFTKSLAKELGPSKIRVNAIAPGFIETDMTADIMDDKRIKLIQSIPLQRFGTVQEVASAAMFIAQNEYFHGQVLSIDGGLTIV
ncbi:3-oxoacyl-reductase [Backusella circina FSU 941]|nr:3-oxoacyl-reductase [Backusella circina FSU 941]